MGTPSTGADPVRLDLDAPLEIRRWLPLVTWLLVIPHGFVLMLYGIAAFGAAVGAFFSLLFTGRIPSNLFVFLARVGRYSWRVTSYSFFMRDSYPKFGLAGDASDPGDDPATYEVDEAEHLDRWKVLYKWILAIPHFVVLWLLGIGVSIALAVGFVMVLFTGEWPEEVRAFIVKVTRWQYRVSVYVLLRDEYPRFALD